jgi:hypothetical protein
MTAGGHSAPTAADGTYTISGLSPGSYRVSPTLAGCTFRPTFRLVKVLAADVVGINFAANAIPPALVSLTLDRGSAKVGDTVTGTVALTRIALAPVTVSLSSSDRLTVPVPVSVVVPRGQASATFTVTVRGKVARAKTVTLTAGYRGARKSAKLVVSP